jgi:hypothetical protein
LFVQSAKSVTYDKAGAKLALRGVSPATIVFSDRPKRLAVLERGQGQFFEGPAQRHRLSSTRRR